MPILPFDADLGANNAVAEPLVTDSEPETSVCGTALVPRTAFRKTPVPRQGRPLGDANPVGLYRTDHPVASKVKYA